MRKALLAAAALTLIAACNNFAGASTPIRASGSNADRNYQVASFERVSLAAPYQVNLTVGGQPSVSAQGDSALLEKTEILVENGRLIIRLQHGHNWSGASGTINVTAPALNAADIAGSGDIRVSPFQTQRFAGSVAGSGNLSLERLQADEARFNIAGSGDVSATGTARDTAIDIAGSGNARLSALQAQSAQISIAGSGNAELNATGTAAISIAGSGNASVSGGARCQVSRVGSGNANCG